MSDAAGPVEHLELPRPGRLLRTLGWNLAESFGLPTLAYVVGQVIAGRNAALLAATAAVWLVALVRRLVTGSIPGMVAISTLLMTVQTLLIVATGSTWIFLLHFPLANLAMSVAFARTAQTARPLVAQLAGELIGLRTPSAHHPGLHRFFRGATWLWAGLFLLKTIGFAILMVTTPMEVFLVLMTVVTVAVVAVGAGFCGLWFVAVLRRSGLGLRFAV